MIALGNYLESIEKISLKAEANYFICKHIKLISIMPREAERKKFKRLVVSLRHAEI